MADTLSGPNGLSVLVIFGAGALYGMERGVIEIFDLLRPDVEPHFLISRTPRRLSLPIFEEIQRRKFSHTFLSDYNGWERLGKPRSIPIFCTMLVGLLRGNLDALREVRRHRVLYVPNLYAAYYSLLAMVYCRVTRRRVFYHFHDLLTHPSLQLRLMSLLVTDFVHNTALGRVELSKANPYVESRHNWIIPYPVRRKSQDTGARGLSSENVHRSLLFVGQIAKHKGVDILLDAFDTLKESYPELTLNLLGGCDDELLKQRLQESHDRNGGRAKWWGYRDDVADFLKQAYVYIHPSPPSIFKESFGIGMLEAMSSGVPGVCFRSGGLEEIVIHEQTGLICEGEQPETLAAAIGRFLSNVQFRNECGEQARRRYQEHYAPSMVKELWLEALNDIRENR